MYFFLEIHLVLVKRSEFNLPYLHLQITKTFDF